MSSKIEDRINFLVKTNKENKLKKEIEKTSVSLRKDLKDLNISFKSSKDEMNDMIVQTLSKGNEELAEIKETLNKKEQDINSLKKNIKGIDRIDELSKIKEDIKSLSNELDPIPGISRGLAQLSSNLTQSMTSVSKLGNNIEEQKKTFFQKSEDIENVFDNLKKKINELSSQLTIKDSEIKKLNRLREIIEKSSKENTIIMAEFREGVKKDLGEMEEELNDLNTKSANKRDINLVSVDINNKIDKLHKKVSDMNTAMKNKLIEISKKSKELNNDDINEVMSQISLLDKDE